jgi:hypothetical protein
MQLKIKKSLRKNIMLVEIKNKLPELKVKLDKLGRYL